MTSKLDSLTAKLNKTSITPGGLSFAGQGLKISSAEDAASIVDAINKCPELHYLNLEGNTLGIEGAKAISEALEKHGELKRGLWKDLFTGRMKDEIPIALKYLGNGLLKANAHLTELDLSDNAFGPIGVEGLAILLKSSCCFELQILRLNNNGLGITGGKMLSNALLNCYKSSSINGKPLALKVFVAGRNRLENPGATALAEVFKTIGTLEEISMPQNGIYHLGITALADAFKSNLDLQIINLNDNTLGAKGARSLARAITLLKKLRIINFGDCLLKTKGTVAIAESLIPLEYVEEIYLDCNEVRLEGANKLLNIIQRKVRVKKISINGNNFGEEGVKRIRNTLEKWGRPEIMASLSEDEGEDDDDEDSTELSSASDKVEEEEDEHVPNPFSCNPIRGIVGVKDFMANPSYENLIAIGENRRELLLQYAQVQASTTEKFIETCMRVLMNVAGLINRSKQEPVNLMIVKCCEQLCAELFGVCQQHDKISILNNMILVSLGLIKSEDKFSPPWDIEGCLVTFSSIVTKNYFPQSTRDTLKCFIQRDVSNNQGKHLEAKRKLLLHLH